MIAHLLEETALTADQIYAIGFGDGLAGRVKSAQFREHLDYVCGHVRGYRSRFDSLYNLAQTQESYLERGWGDELLNPL